MSGKTYLLNFYQQSQYHLNFFFAGFNFLKQKWLVSCSYNLHKNTISKHKRMLNKNLDLCSSQYDNNFILGDSNVGVSDPHIKYFYNLSDVT